MKMAHRVQLSHLLDGVAAIGAHRSHCGVYFARNGFCNRSEPSAGQDSPHGGLRVVGRATRRCGAVERGGRSCLHAARALGRDAKAPCHTQHAALSGRAGTCRYESRLSFPPRPRQILGYMRPPDREDPSSLTSPTTPRLWGTVSTNPRRQLKVLDSFAPLP